ncbi:MAG: orotidine-5'-phosphate decarboxylase [Chloroflexi bacterium]|nr:orotidine-5'-phosphate decarboxylase [Chloroflexota bacterium]
MSFVDKLRQAQEQTNSWVCVGLDPVPERLPSPLGRDPRPFLSFCQAIVDATSDVVCAYKPNLGFWLSRGPEGLADLIDVIACVPSHIPVVLDGKFGDIGHTASAYAAAAYEVLGADAVTANPYLGIDGIRPFVSRSDRAAFILARTSNPSAPDVQNESTEAGFIYEDVARLALSWDGECVGDCGLVVGATYPDELSRLRRIAPTLPFLIPGIGAQGGSLADAVENGATVRGVGPLINSSRGILYASSQGDYAKAARAAAIDLRNEINLLRRTVT